MSNNKRDPASRQLEEWYEKNKSQIGYVTSEAGVAVPYADSSITVGKYGPIVLEDFNLFEQLAHFNRERIPERVVHAKGAGAFGYFEVTHDISKYTVSKVFEYVGKKTNIAVRFSQVAGNLGSADTVRDPRGFALKFYTEEGIWDLVGNNTPIFFMRDPILFPMFIKSQKRNPVTNLRDWDMFWDYLSLRPESTHQVMFLFSDRGIPDGHRHQHGFGSHTFSLIGKDRKLTWCKFIYKTNQGIKNLDPDKAQEIAGKDPDYALRDLYNAIENGKKTKEFPSWTFYIQVMTPEEAKHQSFNPFDITKVWPHEDFPLIKVGKFVLNQNPGNYFADIEQIAFSPNNLTPGIGASPDRLLQGRLISYQDTHRYRLGANYEQLVVNTTLNKVSNFQRDGRDAVNNQGGAPNYHPNSFGGPDPDPNAMSWIPPPAKVEGDVDYYDLGEDDNYSQPRVFWNKVLDEGGKSRLVDNLANSLKMTSERIRNRAVEVFSKVDPDMGDRLRNMLATEIVVNL
ncbi:catalase-like [Anoplophora glabripennis]|uniref:catalase-like n=1 Tax=Anoplophora glabripennis TaxID=217634 RepID=UPI00087492E1|nr:catalase-like [Anoplophora glabripennis]